MQKSAFYISEVVFGDQGYVVVTNGSDSEADIAGLSLCQFPEYPEIPGGLVASGESVRVAASELGGLDNQSGEVGLYLRPDWSDPDAIAGYVQWGTTGHKREEPAVAAGVWAADSFVDAQNSTRMIASGSAVAAGDWIVA